ncbi:hypothetical protein [uncultured Ruminococcus sp.]|uniref:hypothetical protein n=1 Tax=uncultured Ruminococcus sp. TaxID=165186 RepID=UPI0029312DA1|nr:hypothetical protein [uncultured Ruminococcus sp.]
MTDYIILMPLLILIFGLTPIVARDSYLNKNQKNIMLWIIGLIGVLIAQNVADYVLQTVVSMPYLRTLESIVGYSVRPVIIILFCKLVKPNGKYRIAWILAIYNAAVYFTATFHFHGGFLYFGKTVFVVSFLLLFYLIYCTVSEYRGKKTWIWIPITNTPL